MINLTIGERIKALREEKTNLTQTQLGKVLNLSQLQISRIETNRAHMNDETLIIYCKFFKVSADYILGLPKGMKYPER